MRYCSSYGRGTLLSSIEEHGGNLVLIWLIGLFFATVYCYAADVWFELTTLARVILVLTCI